MREQDIAVVGMECILPGASNLSEYWRNLTNGVDAIGDMPRKRWYNALNMDLPHTHEARLNCTRGGFVPDSLSFDPMRYGVMPNVVAHGEAEQFVTLKVIDTALKDANVADDSPVRRKTDVFVGRGGYLNNKMTELFVRVDMITRLRQYLEEHLGWDQAQVHQLEDILRATLPKEEPDGLSTCIPNLVASRTSNRLNLGGVAYNVDAACASSLIAVEQAMERLRRHDSDLAVACGVHLCQSPSFWYVFTQLTAISPTSNIRPFDRRADGLLLGEGVGAVVLKRLSDAVRDGNRIYAVVKGAASASDGRDTGVLAPSYKGQLETLRRAYANAQVDPDTISVLEAHGTGTPVGDAAEFRSINEFFGPRKSRSPFRALGSVKSMIGHAMPAGGVAAMIKICLALTHKVIPASLHCEEPLPEFENSAFYVNTQTRPWIHPQNGNLRRAGVNAFGFGGINSHLVLEEVPEVSGATGFIPLPRPIELPIRRPQELLAFSAADAAGLAQQLRQLKDFIAQDQTAPALEEIAAAVTQEPGQPVRLALLPKDLEDLQQMLDGCLAALDQGQWPAADNERIHFSAEAAAPPGKIAALFPGLAFPGLIGDYPSHLLELALHFPEVRTEFDKVEGKDNHPEDAVPFSHVLVPPPSIPETIIRDLKQRVAPPRVHSEDVDPPATLPADRNLAAAGVTLSNWVSWALLRQFQIPIDMTCGQSLGDISALCASGVIDFDADILPNIWSGLAIEASYTGKGRMAFVGMGEAKLQQYLADFPDLGVSIDLSPDAVIVGGETSQINELTKRLRKDGVMANGLPFPPGHTPRLSYMRDRLVKTLGSNADPKPPKLALYSAILCDLYPHDIDGLRETMLSNLDRTVRFWQTNRRMYDDGARVFIQVGGGSLASNIKNQLHQDDIVSTAMDVDYRDAISQVQQMLATLCTSGVTPDLNVLYRHRALRQLDLSKPQGPPKKSRTEMPLALYWAPFVATEAHASVTPKQAAPLLPGADNTRFLQPLLATTAAQNVSHAAQPVSHAVQPGSHSGAAGQVHGAYHPAAAPDQPADWSHAPIAASDPPPLPFLGTVTYFEPETALTFDRTLHLDEDLFLHDHYFVHALAYKSLEDCLPIVPMTMSVEIMSEAAACLAPGLGVIGFEDIRAFRWIAVAEGPTCDLHVEAALAAVDEETGVRRIDVKVHANGQLSATGTVLLGQAYRQDVELQFAPFEDAAPWHIPAEAIYTDKHMFHGPSFHTLTGLGELSARGCTAELSVLPPTRLFKNNPAPQLLIDPCVLDGVGQMLGLWAQTQGVHVLPVSIGKMELYGPTPPPGTRCPVRLEVQSVDYELRTVNACMEVEDGNGFVWMRLRDWNDWIFRWPPKLLDTQRRPDKYCIANRAELPGLPPDSICMMVSRKDTRQGQFEWLARLYLTCEEISQMHTRQFSENEQWQFLLGRIAVKDAVRTYLSEGLGNLLHPLLITVHSDERGRPYLEPIPGFESLPQISLSHTRGSAAAIAAPGESGIDIEPVTRDTRAILADFTREDEAAMLQPLAQRQPQFNWPTRLWCAKEAVSKRLGTGLDGRPRNFELVKLDDSGRMWIQHQPTGRSFEVNTVLNDSLVVAFSSET